MSTKLIENNMLNLKMLNEFSLNSNGTKKPIINIPFIILLSYITQEENQIEIHII